MRHYLLANLLLAVAVAWSFLYGGYAALLTVLMLCALEVSVSFDNAVVNAKVLGTMETKWRQRFITFGIPVAVFGMRLLFPILIVSLAAGISMYDAGNMALTNPQAYHHALEANEHTIFAFGGSFLLMVFLSFIFDAEKETHWIKSIESNKLTLALCQVPSISLILASVAGLYLVHLTNSATIAIAYFSGIILFAALNSLDDVFSSDGVKSGLIGFLYLEILDASFSFDGVIGAFALSSDIFIIMAGLGVGAMYVRSITIHLVEAGTLAEFKYLEHGAHYAIGALAFIMFMKMFTEVNELIVGGLGVAFIVIALITSKLSEQD